MNHQNVHIPLEETLLMLPNISMTSAFTQRKRGLLYWIIAVWMLAADDSIGAGFPQNAHFKSKKPNVVIVMQMTWVMAT